MYALMERRFAQIDLDRTEVGLIMNAERLAQLIDFLREQEASAAIDQRLNDLNRQLSAFVSQPQVPQHQSGVAEALTALQKAVDEFESSISPAQVNEIEQIGASEYFGSQIIENLRKLISENAMTPAVVANYLSNFVSKRAEYINDLNNTWKGFKTFNIAASQLEEGDAEIIFRIPRDIFSNDLPGLSKELHTLDLIIKFISEAATGQAENAEIKQLSTSDPTFYFGLSPEVIQAIGDATTWCLKALKSIAEFKEIIEKLKNKGIKKNKLSPIQDEVDAANKEAIDKKVAEILASREQDQHRVRELDNGLHWALESLMARVERGVTVEIKLIPPQPMQDQDEVTSKKFAELFSSLEQIKQQLEFPSPAGTPVVALPAPEPPPSAEAA